MSKNTDLSSLINYVKGASTGQLNAPSYTSATSFTGTIAGYLGFDSSGNILTTAGASQWITSGSNIYYNSGNVGIGTSSPTARLDVTTSASWMATFNSTDANGGFIRFRRSGTDYGFIGSSYHLLTPAGPNDAIAISSSNTVIFGTGSSLSERLRLESNGNFTIPWLNQMTQIMNYDNTYRMGTLYQANARTLTFYSCGGDANPSITFNTRLGTGSSSTDYGTERMRIGSNGNIGIGTTDITTYTAAPLNILAKSSFAIRLIGDASTNRSLIMFFPNTGLGAGYATIGCDNTSFYISASNTSFLDLGGFGGGGIRIISSNGRVLIGSTTDQGAFLLQVNSQIWATNSTIATSDLRLKENVSDLDSSLNLLMGIKPRTFTYKQNTEYNFTEKGVTVGFIAQELKELLEGTSYANSIVVEAGKYYGVAYEKIIPLLVKGIQELKTELDTIKLKNQ